jgi:hypothetical protein
MKKFFKITVMVILWIPYFIVTLDKRTNHLDMQNEILTEKIKFNKAELADLKRGIVSCRTWDEPTQPIRDFCSFKEFITSWI